jgi:hypothetical protein
VHRQAPPVGRGKAGLLIGHVGDHLPVSLSRT